MVVIVCFLLVNGDEDVEVDEGEDEEELYELTSLPNGDTSDISSEAEGGQGEEQTEMSDSNEKDAASCQSGTTLNFQRAVIEDIRFVFMMSTFTVTYIVSTAYLYLSPVSFLFLTGRGSLVLVWN